ncbi:MAG: CHAT domain-containing protein [Candidatus Helarchaeota archaeon]
MTENIILLIQKGLNAKKEGDLEGALDFYQEALDCAQRESDRQALTVCLNNIGDLYYIWGKYEEAISYYHQTLELDRELGDKKGESISLNNIGDVYYAWHKFEEAMTYYQQSLQLREKIQDKKSQSISLNNIGDIYYAWHKFDEAFKYYQESLTLRKEIADEKGQGESLNNIGDIYFVRKNYTEALKYYNQSLQIQNRINNKLGISICLNNIGTVYQACGKYQEAIKNFQKSLQISETLGDRPGKSISLTTIASCLWKQRDFKGAFEYFSRAIDIYEELIGEVKSEEIRISYRGKELGPYKLMTEMLLEWYEFDKKQVHLEDALKFLELAKAREILDKLEQNSPDIQPCPELRELIEKEQQLIEEKMVLVNKKNQELTRGIVSSEIDQTLMEKTREWKRIRVELMEKCRDPGLIRNIQEYNPIPDLKAIFKQENVVIWEFIYFSDMESYEKRFKILVWDKNKITLFQSNPFNRDELLGILKNYHKTLSDKLLNQLQQNITRLLPKALFQTLQNKTKLILIPHNILHLIPWEIIEQIGLQLPLICNYSLSLTRICMKREKPMKNILLIANPNFNLEQWDLPGTDKEINSITQILQKVGLRYEILTHESATEFNFTKLLQKEFGIIHFAGHGIYNTQDPWMSGFYFYRPDGYDIRTVTELLTESRFKGTPLFILSACETGRSDFSTGDEMIGLIRGLTLAGATSIIATNWLLSDEIAPLFMRLFYESFLQDNDVCISLFKARKFIYKSYPHPFFWGVYTLYGNPFKKLKTPS